MSAVNVFPNGQAVILADKAQALAHYPHARVAGGLIFVSGISSRKLDNTYEGVIELPDGTLQLDIRAQTRAVLDNIKGILESVGASLRNLVDITVFLVDMGDYAAFNEVYNKYFEAETGPSRTTVAVKQLPSVSSNY
ncbi:9693_t:CDS:2 [Ambispora leptoticha]|uniref:9693_t:CDS:1 n=1 Tax=Ambispora leptoticha TaxID=144679 RepID=A0A9N8VZH0_9GLOM|nr:9693_t:CDS:2 [Ambispora leptoticha]